MTFRGMSTLGAAAACAVALAVGCAENPVRPILNSGSSGVNVDWLTNFRDPSTGPWEFAGTVFEHTASGTSRPVAGLELQVTECGPAPSHNPVAGAGVELDYDGTALSRTVSDAAGRYLLCSFPPGTGTDQLAIVRARKPGYRDGVPPSKATRPVILAPRRTGTIRSVMGRAGTSITWPSPLQWAAADQRRKYVELPADHDDRIVAASMRPPLISADCYQRPKPFLNTNLAHSSALLRYSATGVEPARRALPSRVAPSHPMNARPLPGVIAAVLSSLYREPLERSTHPSGFPPVVS